MISHNDFKSGREFHDYDVIELVRFGPKYPSGRRAGWMIIHLAKTWFFGYQCNGDGCGGIQMLICVIPFIAIEFRIPKVVFWFERLRSR